MRSRSRRPVSASHTSTLLAGGVSRHGRHCSCPYCRAPEPTSDVAAASAEAQPAGDLTHEQGSS